MKGTLISLITLLVLMTTTSTVSAQSRSSRKEVRTSRQEIQNNRTSIRAQYDRRATAVSSREEWKYDNKPRSGYVAFGVGSIVTQHQFTDPHIGWDWKNILTNFDVHLDVAWNSGLLRVDYHRFEFCDNIYNVISPLLGAKFGKDVEFKALVGPAYDITGQKWLAKTQAELSGKIFKNTYLYLLVDANWDFGDDYFDQESLRVDYQPSTHGSFDRITNVSIGVVEKF